MKSRAHICNPAEGSDRGTAVHIFLPGHVFCQAVKHQNENKNTTTSDNILYFGIARFELSQNI